MTINGSLFFLNQNPPVVGINDKIEATRGRPETQGTTHCAYTSQVQSDIKSDLNMTMWKFMSFL